MLLIYCKIGYLLGLKYEDKHSPCLIEVSNQIIEISQLEYLCWLAVGTERHSKATSQATIESLLEKGLLVEMNSSEDSTHKLLNYKLIRQGMGTIAPNHKYGIFLVEFYELPELQMLIWQKSNGCRTIGEIFNQISQNKSIDLVDFINQIIFLVGNAALFIC